jgi:hypothetical protein
MFAELTPNDPWILVIGGIALSSWVVLYCLSLRNAQPEQCQICVAGRHDVLALEHDKCCPLRLEFFGGDAGWDQRELQVSPDGFVYYFDKDVHSWRPQSE